MATHRYRAVASANIDCRQAERLFVAVGRVGDGETTGGGMPVEAVLRDISPFGCRLAVPGSYVMGERLVLRIGGGMEVSATVAWGTDGVIGCRFDQSMSRTALRQITLGRG